MYSKGRQGRHAAMAYSNTSCLSAGSRRLLTPKPSSRNGFSFWREEKCLLI